MVAGDRPSIAMKHVIDVVDHILTSAHFVRTIARMDAPSHR